MKDNKYRSHNCSEINEHDTNKIVKLSGWIHRIRDHNKIIFVDLRDHTGIIQTVMKKQDDENIFNKIKNQKLETVISITGIVTLRSISTINNDMPTGKIEILINKISILNKSKTLPFSISNDNEYISESIRLKYRYLDLRRNNIKKNILLRSAIIMDIRKKMMEMGFIEFQTPILTKSSPEGARDYLVPSRIHKGKFYALPQAPQQFKQLLMIAGFDKYFQIAPCFRDEDARADRSPGEFYQLDLEMNFVTQDNVFRVTEELFIHIFKKYAPNKKIITPFIKIKYHDSMSQYGSDKPDLRNPLKIIDITKFIKNDNAKRFFDKQSNNEIKAILIKNTPLIDSPKSFFEKIIQYAKSIELIKFGYIICKEQFEFSGSMSKLISKEELKTMNINIEKNDVLFIMSEDKDNILKLSGKIREKLGIEFNLIDENIFYFCWITDIPMYEIDKNTNNIIFGHNPFSMPVGGLKALNTKNPLDIIAYQYDIVCNGIELSSGAIRNNNVKIIYKAFEIAGYKKSDIDKNFSGMISSLQFGAPPHGGIAPGIDRIVMLLTNEINIREVIAFPLNQQAQDLMLDAPSSILQQQLDELNIAIKDNTKDNL